MTIDTNQISATARMAAQKGDWQTVSTCAQEILRRDDDDPEGHFLTGLVEKAAMRSEGAIDAFTHALQLNPERYDAAIELASRHAKNRDYRKAGALLDQYESYLGNSPRYLDMAGSAYTIIKMWEKAWPLFKKANELQPNIELFEANIAYCAATLGKIDEAKKLYERLLQRRPHHMRNHYNLCRLEKARDETHVNQMKQVLQETNLSPDRNVYVYYALGKELEDLEQWDESFKYYKMGGDAVSSVSTYRLQDDIDVINNVIDVCDSEWLNGPGGVGTEQDGRTPIFVLGLPRTGTTLTERTLSSHSQIASVGETQFIEMAVRSASGIKSNDIINSEMIAAYKDKDIAPVAKKYLAAVDYLPGDERYFVDKLPYNFIYIGFIAKAFPDARIVHLRRNPMDACFAMYKQVFSWAFRCSYTFQDLGRYYVAYDRIMRHWRSVLGERLIEIEYEKLVADQERETRILLDRVGVPFEEACLNFHENKTPTATASSIQVREKVHTRSVGRWKHYAKHLEPLREYLESQGIEIEAPSRALDH